MKTRTPVRLLSVTRVAPTTFLAMPVFYFGFCSCCGSPSTTLADEGAPQGIVLYTTGVTGDSEIFALDVAAGRTWNVTCSSGSQDGDAALSPDKEHIAFASDRNGHMEIYTMRIDGSDVQQLTHHGVYAAHPTWSPDGAWIAFHMGPIGQWDIGIVSADGSDLRQVTSNPASDFHPVWSPVANQIVFESMRAGPPNLFLYDVDTGDLTQLTDDSGSNQQAAWSPDGSRILFNSDRDTGETSFDLYVMNMDGTDIRRLTTFPGHDEFGVWSPDGSRIAFSQSDNARDQIAVMNADGSDSRVATTNPGVPDVWYMPSGPHQIPPACR